MKGSKRLLSSNSTKKLQKKKIIKQESRVARGLRECTIQAFVFHLSFSSGQWESTNIIMLNDIL